MDNKTKQRESFSRLTYKSCFGDYGSDRVYRDTWEELSALRNALGKYEDIGYTPEELKDLLKEILKTS